MRIDLTRIQVGAVAAHIRDLLGEDLDDQLLLDCLEGETDLYEISRKLLNAIEEAEGKQAALQEQINDRLSRKSRFAEQVKHSRVALMSLMECAGLDKLALPEATLSVRKIAPKPIVTDEGALPDEFCKFTRKPDLAAIKAAETLPPGVVLDNGGQSLTVRRK